MGTVFGVHLKYVAMSAAGMSLGVGALDADWCLTSKALAWLYFGAANGTIALLFMRRQGMWCLGKDPQTGKLPLWSYVVGVFGLSWSGIAAQNLTSYCAMQVWSSFFAPTFLYTFVHHHVLSKVLLVGAVEGPSGEKEAVPAATEVIVPNPEAASLEPTTCLSDLVHPGWWLGGRYASELGVPH